MTQRKQYSEDDTFNKLRRTTIQEMAATVTDYCLANGVFQLPKEILEPMLNSQGWTKETYLGEVERLERKLGIIE
jgi:hypothetical protein